MCESSILRSPCFYVLPLDRQNRFFCDYRLMNRRLSSACVIMFLIELQIGIKAVTIFYSLLK